MIEISKLKKAYGQLEVLKSVDLKLNQKEVVAIVGPSGAGKTTLLQIIGALDRGDSGKVMVQDKDIMGFNQKKLARYRNEEIGFIFQFHNLLPEFTAVENVCIPALLGGKKLRNVQARAEALLDELGLSHRLDHKPNSMSGGEQQRVAVARALMNQPKIILADEPSGNLDTENARHLHELFFKLRDQHGLTILMVTHNEDLANMADRKLTMLDGKILAE